MDPSSVFLPQKTVLVKPRCISYKDDFHRSLESGLNSGKKAPFNTHLQYGFQAINTSFFFSSTHRGVRPGVQGLFLQMLRSLQLLLLQQTRCKFVWRESHRAQAVKKASLRRCPEMHSYQLWTKKKSERLPRMAEEKLALQVREQRGLCLLSFAMSRSPCFGARE